ncbi:LLM class flavin-dependent oxidoreductase [Streptomyces sp. NPDC001843]|uniref:LLM class flavin-dependent oxidoreductase n=1 Tax=Streptomyces sp. NPDC001843 TaxID=3364617 RepID=UPI00369B453E
MHLAALSHFDPRSTPRIEFSSFEHLARTAERGLFDFLLLADGPRPREHKGRSHAADAVERPESLTVLNALAAVTERLGLAATVDATRDHPYELARRLTTLDHLSAGRAAWNPVTSSDAFTGENGVAELVAVARQLWGSWTPDALSRPFAHRGRRFDIAGGCTVPRSPQGHPVVIQAGDSDECREFAASTADVIFTGHGTPEAGRSFYADVKRRLEKYGRAPDDLKIMPGVAVVLGDTDAEAQERAAGSRAQQAGRQFFVGTPETVATELEEFVRRGSADGFVLVPHDTSGALDDFVDRVVPLLQKRGAFRRRYEGPTLRSHLGLPDPVSNG